MKKFLFSVADVYGYKTGSSELLFKSQTLIDSSIETTISNEDARAGKGNKLQFVYYHTAEFNVKLTEQQWNMELLAPSIGSTIQANGIRQVSETVVVSSNNGTVTTGTPVNSSFVDGTAITGFVEDKNGITTEVVFTGTTFAPKAGSIADGTYCVTYNIQDTNTRFMEVDANLVPSIVRLVMKAQLGASTTGSADSSSSVIGEVEIEVPTVQLNPSALTLQMTSSGISNTPMSGRALAYSNSTSGGCTSTEIYAQIKETIYGQAPYSDLRAFVITNSDIEMSKNSAANVNCLVIPLTGAPYAPTSGLTYSIDAGTATGTTINVTTGVITSGSEVGTAVVTATLTNGTSTWTATANVEVIA